MADINNCTREIFLYITNAQLRLKFTLLVTLSFPFVYINIMMFATLWSKPVFRETPRYILFAHMLFNDSVQLLFSSLLGIITPCMPVKAICSVIILVTDSTSRIAPLNLAVMSLERYAAICFPLHHTKLVTAEKTFVAIASVWLLGLVNPLVDSMYSCLTDPHFFTEQVECGTDGMFISAPWQESLYQALNGLYYVAVTIVILYSYVSIMLVARSVSSDRKSASKARKTLLLHLLQLGLCLNTLLFGNIASFLAVALSYKLYYRMRYTIYLMFVLLPRCLSPLIYGLRDEALRCLFIYHVRCGPLRAKMSVHVQALQ